MSMPEITPGRMDDAALGALLSEPIDWRNIEAGLREVGHQCFDRRQPIEPNGMRDLVRTARIVREHDRHAFLGRRLLREAPPGGNARGDGLHALLVGAMRQM